MREGKARKLDIKIKADIEAIIHFNSRHLLRQLALEPEEPS